MPNTDTAPHSPSTRRAFERTVLPHMDAMYGQALKLTRNAAEAEDLVQEAMIRALRFFDSYDPEQAPRAWLFTIVRNTFRNRYAALNRRRDVHAAAAAEAVGHAPVPDAEAAMEAGEAAVAVREAVDALPPEFAAVVRAVDLEGMAYLEAAAALDLPKGTVMSRLHRGRKRLAVALGAA
jgi:RNA polymerase sigma-70 factor (ECF subfamily)